MYADIAPHDPDEVLQDEYLNARGAIARFGRGSIEIRVIDIQECPAADLAVLQAVAALIRALVEERWCSLADQQSVPVEPLADLFNDAVSSGDETNLSDPALLRVFGCPPEPRTLVQLWRQIDDRLQPEMEPEVRAAFNHILEHGPLSRRIRRRLPDQITPEAVRHVAAALCDCLASGRQLE
jgi:hypothetical protein